MFLEDLFPELAAAFDVSTRAMKRWIAEIRIYEGWDIEYYRMANRYVLKGIEKDEKIHFFLLIPFFVPEWVVICRDIGTNRFVPALLFNYLSYYSIMKKLKLFIVITLCLGLAVPSFSVEDGSEKTLRQGTCFCDGTTNCRNKKEGVACPSRDACSALACVDLVVKVLNGASSIDQLSN